jgi:outer membrane protein assembly factor BamB
VPVPRLGDLPIFDDETIFVRTTGSDGYIYSIDQDTGKVNWKVSQNIYSNLFLANKRIYFLSSNGYLVAIDRNTGMELSRVKFTVQFALNDPKTSGDYCVNGDPENNVLVLAFRDNSQLLGLRVKKP